MPFLSRMFVAHHTSHGSFLSLHIVVSGFVSCFPALLCLYDPIALKSSRLVPSNHVLLPLLDLSSTSHLALFGTSSAISSYGIFDLSLVFLYLTAPGSFTTRFWITHTCLDTF